VSLTSRSLRTPETLSAFLDDVSTVGWLAARLPQTTFHFMRGGLSLDLDIAEGNA
jgi:hypothetical protein